jgi:hypothetical protein
LYLIYYNINTFFAFCKNNPDVRFLLAEGMVVIEKELGNFEVLLECPAPILRIIFSYKISSPEIALSKGVPDPKIIDPVHVIYDTNNGRAELIFKDDKKTEF